MTGAATLTTVERALRGHFGHDPLRASVSFVGVDPIEILRFEPVPGERVLVSLGMSSLPMTAAAQAVRSQDGPRAELMVQVRDPTDAFADLWRRLAVLAAAPAVEGVVYQPGMTVDLGEPLAAGSRCTGGVLVESGLARVEAPAGPVDILQLVPALSVELGWARVRGTAELRERWVAAGTELWDLARAPVALG